MITVLRHHPFLLLGFALLLLLPRTPVPTQPSAPVAAVQESQRDLQAEQRILRQYLRQQEQVAKPANPELALWVDFLGESTGKVAFDLSEHYSIPHAIARRLIMIESHGNPDLISATHDYGLMQLNAGTWPWLAEKVGLKDPDPLRPADNLEMGFWLLNDLRQKHGDCWDCILTEYNRGSGGYHAYVVSRGTSRSDYSDAVLGRK